MYTLALRSATVLTAIDDGARHGFDIMDATGLPSGTVYPILGRLEESGYVRSQWEAPAEAQRARRPPRRYYELTTEGRVALVESLKHYQTLGGRLPAPAPTPSKVDG